MKTYQLFRGETAGVSVVWSDKGMDGKPISMTLAARPDLVPKEIRGEWQDRYELMGAGADVLAVSLLADALNNEDQAVGHCGAFRAAILDKISLPGTVTEADILAWASVHVFHDVSGSMRDAPPRELTVPK